MLLVSNSIVINSLFYSLIDCFSIINNQFRLAYNDVIKENNT